MKDKTALTRKREHLKRLKKSGLVQVSFWITPEQKEKLRIFIENIRKTEN